MDIIDRLDNSEMCMDAIDDAIILITALRAACNFGGRKVKGPDMLENLAMTVENVGHIPGAGGGGHYMADVLREKARMERAALEKLETP